MSCLAEVTPSIVAELLRDHPPPPSVPSSASEFSADDEERLWEAVIAADGRGDALAAVDGLMDLLEFLPGSAGAYAGGVERRLLELYPMGAASRLASNQSSKMHRRLQRSVSTGAASRVSEDPPIYLLHNFLSGEEASTVRAAAVRRRKQWSTQPPIVCFLHEAYTGHPALRHAWSRLKKGKPARGCLSEAASAIVAPVLRHSESLSIYRGQEELLDKLSGRVYARTGLGRNHSYPWQVFGSSVISAA